MSRLAVALLALLALPSSASAATFGELPFQSLPDRQAAGCLRPTGSPDGLALFGRPGSLDLWRADGGGTARGERARLGRHVECAAVAEAGGAGVAAAVVSQGGRNEVRAVTRDAGGAFGPPATVSGGPRPEDVAAAVSATGHAAVVWTERRGSLAARHLRLRVVLARRAAGQGFGAPEPLTGWWTSEGFDVPDPAVGVDASGTVSVVWSQGERRGFGERVNVAVAAPGAAFSRQRLDTSFGSVPAALAVAADGWTVVAQAVNVGIAVFERPPGAARFTRVETVPRSETYDFVRTPAAAVAGGGGAVVAWRTDSADPGGGVAAMTRAPGGAFAAPEIVTPARRPSSGNAVAVLDFRSAPPIDIDADRVRVAIGPGGRALLAWTAHGRRSRASRALAATGVLGAGFDEPQDVSRSVRAAEAVAPLFLADGRAAVAWIDNATSGKPDGRLHLAVEGTTAPASAAPRLSVEIRRVQRLFPSQPVRVTARCDRPCDVLGAIRGVEDVTVTLPAGGSAELELPRRSIYEARRFRHGRMTVDLLAAAPGGSAVARRSVRVRVVGRPPLPLRRPLDVRARRRGDEIVVRWRTAGPARRMYFSLFGHRARRPRGLDPTASGFERGRGRTRFAVRLRPNRPARVRWVTLYAASEDRRAARSTTVRVR